MPAPTPPLTDPGSVQGNPNYHRGDPNDPDYYTNLWNENRVSPGNPGDPTAQWGSWDPNTVYYNAEGNPIYTGAQTDIDRYRQMGAQAGANRAPQINYGQANQFLGMGQYARNQQTEALRLQQQAAMGNAPSVAQAQMQQGLGQALNQGQALAAGARGAGAMGIAQANAAQGAAGLQAQTVGNAAALRAQEMAQARGDYMAGASGIRAQDYGAAGMTGGWAQNQAALQEQQNALNQQGQLAYEGMGQRVGEDQLNAGLQHEGMGLGQWQTQVGLDKAATDREQQVIGGGVGALSMGIGVLSDADAKAKILPLSGSYSDARAKAGIAPIGVHGFQAANPASHTQAAPVTRIAADPSWDKAIALAKESLRPHEQAPPLNFHGYQPASPASHTQSVVSDEKAKHLSYEAGKRAGERAAPSVVEIPEQVSTGSELDAAHDAIPPMTYAYKEGVPGVQPGIPQAGVIAQDAQRHPLTAAMVRQNPRTGLLELDVPTATSFNLASGSDHNRRIRALERQMQPAQEPWQADPWAAHAAPPDNSYGALSYGAGLYRPEPHVVEVPEVTVGPEALSFGHAHAPAPAKRVHAYGAK
jgi:hypothetical protein